MLTSTAARSLRLKTATDFQKKLKTIFTQGEEYEPCQFFAKNFQTVCPNAWIERWNEQREKVRMQKKIHLNFLTAFFHELSYFISF